MDAGSMCRLRASAATAMERARTETEARASGAAGQEGQERRPDSTGALMRRSRSWLASVTIAAGPTGSRSGQYLSREGCPKRAGLKRARVLYFIAHTYRDANDRWVRSSLIRDKFGPGIYPVLHDLVDEGVLEQREGPTTMVELVARGGRPAFYYRIVRKTEP